MAAKLISESFIRPKHEVSKEQYHLTPVDIGFLALHYLQKGLLFPKPRDFNVIDSLLENLKHALSHVLVHFYPLAGRLTTVNSDNSCWIYLDCNKGPGARFIHAVCTSATLAHVVSSAPDVVPIIRSFFELGEEDVINYDGHNRALLSVQVTELVDGVFIGFTMNHSVIDGTSFWHLVNSFSEIFMSIDDTKQGNMVISHVPIIKPIFPDGYGPITKLPSDFNKFITRFRACVDLNLRERIFHFSALSIARLKDQANAECPDGLRGKISSFQSLCALVWRSITRARRLEPNEIITCSLAADARARFDPPLSTAHLGNLILPIQGSSKVGELLENELGWVAVILWQAIVGVDQKVVRDRGRSILETFLGPQPDSISSSLSGGHSAVVVGGSARFNIYGSEFGLGRAVAARTGYSAKTDGKVTASPGCESKGSIDLEISLSPQAMTALEQDQGFMSFVS